MAKVDKIPCPMCIFTSKYVDLILTNDGYYVCPICDANLSYEEIMQLYSFTQLDFEIQQRDLKPHS